MAHWILRVDDPHRFRSGPCFDGSRKTVGAQVQIMKGQAPGSTQNCNSDHPALMSDALHTSVEKVFGNTEARVVAAYRVSTTQANTTAVRYVHTAPFVTKLSFVGSEVHT